MQVRLDLSGPLRPRRIDALRHKPLQLSRRERGGLMLGGLTIARLVGLLRRDDTLGQRLGLGLVVLAIAPLRDPVVDHAVDGGAVPPVRLGQRADVADPALAERRRQELDRDLARLAVAVGGEGHHQQVGRIDRAPVRGGRGGDDRGGGRRFGCVLRVRRGGEGEGGGGEERALHRASLPMRRGRARGFTRRREDAKTHVLKLVIPAKAGTQSQLAVRAAEPTGFPLTRE
jgi:hypothetical protein